MKRLSQRQQDHIAQYSRWTTAPPNIQGDKLFLIWDSTGKEPTEEPDSLPWQRYMALRCAKFKRGVTVAMYRESRWKTDGSWIGGVNFFLPWTYGPATPPCVDGLIEAFGVEQVLDWFLAALRCSSIATE